MDENLKEEIKQLKTENNIMSLFIAFIIGMSFGLFIQTEVYNQKLKTGYVTSHDRTVYKVISLIKE